MKCSILNAWTLDIVAIKLYKCAIKDNKRKINTVVDVFYHFRMPLRAVLGKNWLTQFNCGCGLMVLFRHK